MRPVLMILATCACAAEPLSADPSLPWSDWDREERTVALNAALGGSVLAFGALFWEYGTSAPRVYDEGWFGAGTAHGGMDKLGHAYTNAAIAAGAAHLYGSWGYDRDNAALGGAASAFATTLLIEIGDSFSAAHGFSANDVAANAAGALWGAARHRFPAFAEVVDFRWSWRPSRVYQWEPPLGIGDPSSDYAGQHYLLALKGRAAAPVLGRWSEAVHLHLGYHATGYQPGEDGARERHLSVGIGIDLSRLINWAGGGDAGFVFDWFQPPGTWQRLHGHEFDPAMP